MRLHLQLEHVVLLDLVAPQVRQRWFLYDHACSHVLQDVVVRDQRLSILLRQNTTSVVVDDQVLLDDALRIDQHDTVKVVVDCVLLDDQLVLALDDVDAFTLAVLDLVVLYLRLAGVLTADSDVGFNVRVDLVGYDMCVATFNDENTLIVVVPNDV